MTDPNAALADPDLARHARSAPRQQRRLNLLAGAQPCPVAALRDRDVRLLADLPKTHVRKPQGLGYRAQRLSAQILACNASRVKSGHA